MLNKTPSIHSLSASIAVLKNSLEPYRHSGVEMAPLAIANLLDLFGMYVVLAQTLEQNSGEAVAAEARACAIDMERYIDDLRRRGRKKPVERRSPERCDNEALLDAVESGKVVLHPRLLYVAVDLASQGGDGGAAA